MVLFPGAPRRAIELHPFTTGFAVYQLQAGASALSSLPRAYLTDIDV